jgi:hypothetical protein
MNPSPSRKQLTIFDAPIIDTTDPNWEEVLDGLIAIGITLKIKELSKIPCIHPNMIPGLSADWCPDCKISIKNFY